MYQEFAVGSSVRLAMSLLCCTQRSWASWVGSIESKPSDRMCSIRSEIQSTCCSIDTIMFDSTDGLPGPVIMYRFGNPTVINPRYVMGPSTQASRNDSPPRPVMSTPTIAPVIASKPVANTIASNSIDSLVSMPVSVMVAIGSLCRLMSRTLSRL